jgi:hypothetical protein
LRNDWFPGRKWGAPKKIDFLTEKPLVLWGVRPKKIDFLIEKPLVSWVEMGSVQRKLNFFSKNVRACCFLLGGPGLKKN